MLPELERKKQEVKDEKILKGKLLSGKHAEEIKAKEKEEQLIEVDWVHKKVRIVEIIKKIQNLWNEELNDLLRTICLVSNKK